MCAGRRSRTAAAPPVSSATASAKACPSCGAPISGRFCEACGHDSALPEPARDSAAGLGVQSNGPPSSPPTGSSTSASSPAAAPTPSSSPSSSRNAESSCSGNTLIGRRNRKQGVEPEIDLGIHPVDRGVSTQHAVLRIRDSGLTITDLGSTNGTSLNDSDELLGNGEEIPLADGDRIHVGAWTTITVTRSEKGRT